MEYRLCPICNNVHSESCEVCKGKGRFPYPWILPEDKLIRKQWSLDETNIIQDAITGKEAYRRYISIYGTSERSYSSVYRHWQYVNTAKPIHPHWTAPEVRILRKAVRVRIAVETYIDSYGAMRTIRAIRAKFYEVRISKV